MASAYTRRAIIVVLAADAIAANADAEAAVPGCGPDTFGPALSATGALPATHRWCNWALTPAQWTALAAKFTGAAATALGRRMYDAASWAPDQVLADVGLRPARAGGL